MIHSMGLLFVGEIKARVVSNPNKDRPTPRLSSLRSKGRSLPGNHRLNFGLDEAAPAFSFADDVVRGERLCFDTVGFRLARFPFADAAFRVPFLVFFFEDLSGFRVGIVRIIAQ